MHARQRGENDFQRLTRGSDPLFKKLSFSIVRKKNCKLRQIFWRFWLQKRGRHFGQILKSGQIELDWHVRSQFN